ncbi:MAG: hypothetical protein AAEJ52_03470 [Myxococcota bacterium]
MSREIQPRGFQESPYERPDHNWVCGWTESGGACPRGPTPDGRCDVSHECTPMRNGERWSCTRAPAYGGACDDGPMPGGTCSRAVSRCQPERTLRAKRGRLTRWATSIAVAGLVLSVAGPMGSIVLSPGPLSSQHAPFEAECWTCHRAGVGGPAEWFSASLAEPAAMSDSARCQECHETGRLPHSVDPANLAVLTQLAAAAGPASGGGAVLTLAGFGPGPPTNEKGELACATCHQEHTGRDAVLTQLTNRQCQACHRSKFSGFGDGHPAFTAYPYTRRTRIRFNHATHQNDHFSQEGTDFACRGCHNPDRRGQVMLVEGFEANCASCHESDVAVPDGIAFVQLPGIDTDALTDAGVQIGEWPSLADIDQDSSFSPYLRIMLASDPQNSEAFDTLPGTPDELIFPELGSDEDEAAAIGQLVWAIKEMLYKLSTEKQSALKEHLDSGLRRTMPEDQLARLSGNFDFDLVSHAVRTWFPNLASEISEQRRSPTRSRGEGYDLGSHPTHIVDTSNMPSAETVWGWSIDPDGVAIRYRPRGHTDPLMQSWLEAAVDPAQHTKPGAMEFAFDALATTEADGKCAKCHSIDVTETVKVINWQQKRRDRRERGFTHYMHRPHLIQPELSDCTACHSLGGEPMAIEAAATAARPSSDDESDSDPAADAALEAPAAPKPPRDSAKAYATGFANGNHDPQVFESNFEPIDHAICASCHQSAAASDSCLNCHTYHVDPARLHGIHANAIPPSTAMDSAVN